MDVYHKVLLRLLEETGGKDSQSVDFKELVKNQGFLGNYDDIFQLLSGKGWIAETNKPDVVKITHWGVKEAKGSHNGAPDDSQALKTESKRVIASVREFLIMLEEFASDASEENFRQVEKKIDEIKSAVEKLKGNI